MSPLRYVGRKLGACMSYTQRKHGFTHTSEIPTILGIRDTPDELKVINE